MAIVNQRQIQEGVIQYAQDKVGGFLSTMTSDLGDFPSVIKERNSNNGEKPIRPDFPYIAVSRRATTRGAGGDKSWLRETYLDENDDWYYVHEHSVGLTLKCYGEDADTILSLLQVSVVDDLFRAELETLTGATFIECSDVRDAPLYIETDFVDGAEMDLNFTAISEWTPASRGSSTIEAVEITGDYEISETTTDITVDAR